MFTGIIESMGRVVSLESDENNLHITLKSPISNELHVDQSVSHDGVCLTVIDVNDGCHQVTAIEETLLKSNLQNICIGDKVNLERAMLVNSRFDGHIVQGHVDQIAECTGIKEEGGSWYYDFKFSDPENVLLVDKGSICINGISLTIVKAEKDQFNVAIIPYTYENTSFGILKQGDKVNIEFDVVGKYLTRLFQMYHS